MKLAPLVEQNATIPPNRKIQANGDPQNSLEIHTNAQEENSPNIHQQFIDNPQLRKERIVKGLQTAELFSKEKTAAQTLELYKSLG